MIDLQTFLDGYKKSEVVFWKEKRVFKEPTLNELKKPVSEILKNNCIEWKYEEFLERVNQLPCSQHKEVLNKIMDELGLA